MSTGPRTTPVDDRVRVAGPFDSSEVNALHAETFEHRTYATHEWNWRNVVESHSLGWVTARSESLLVGFVNVPWDGFVDAWIQDASVSSAHGKQGIGTALVGSATTHARDAGCEWLHVDFDDGLAAFYIDACGLAPARARLIALEGPSAGWIQHMV